MHFGRLCISSDGSREGLIAWDLEHRKRTTPCSPQCKHLNTTETRTFAKFACPKLSSLWLENGGWLLVRQIDCSALIPIFSDSFVLLNLAMLPSPSLMGLFRLTMAPARTSTCQDRHSHQHKTIELPAGCGHLLSPLMIWSEQMKEMFLPCCVKPP